MARCVQVNGEDALYQWFIENPDFKIISVCPKTFVQKKRINSWFPLPDGGYPTTLYYEVGTYIIVYE